MPKHIISHRITLEIDTTDRDTPAMVYAGRFSSTAPYTLATGAVGDEDQILLTQSEIETLFTYETAIDEAYREARKGEPE